MQKEDPKSTWSGEVFLQHGVHIYNGSCVSSLKCLYQHSVAREKDKSGRTPSGQKEDCIGVRPG